jgi:DNA-binding transcriptional MerR regulator
LSVKALRSYHERGILVPASIDPTSGYRAYHPGQLADAVAIRRLRDLDVPLATVKQILDARDPEVTTKLLAEHEREMQDRLADARRIVDDLRTVIGGAGSDTGPAVHVRNLERLDALALSDEVPQAEFPNFLGQAYAKLGQAIHHSGLIPTGPAAAHYAAELHDQEREPVTAYLPVEAPTPTAPLDEVALIELPATTAAVITHLGSYDSIGDTYASLGAWVAYHAEPTGQPVREVYLVSYDQTSDPDQFRTEIQWPIRPLA